MTTTLAELQNLIDTITSSKESLRVLEAGCGGVSNVAFGARAYIVGLDNSGERLAANRVVHDRILADLHAHDFRPCEFDVIICWDVLEHLHDPILVLQKFLSAVKPGGIIILSFPNVLSVKGLVAKCTPFALHTALSRFIYGDRVGTAGYEVCPTVLRYAIAPAAIKRFASRHGYEVPFFSLFESGMQKKFRVKCGVIGPWWRLVRSCVRVLTVGYLDAEGTDCIMVLQRPSTPQSVKSNTA